MEEWNGFNGTKWQQTIDVEDFIVNNFKEYKGSSDFLKGVSRKTSRVWSRCQKLLDKEAITNILDADLETFASIDNFDPGYIDKKNEVIVGLQTDEPLKHFVNPHISLTTSIETLKNSGYRFNHDLADHFSDVGISYEDATEDTYTTNIKKMKSVHLLEGLPDNYGRGFMLGDYRRLPLYGVNYLIAHKKHDLERLRRDINYSVVRTREEVVRQIKALSQIKNMASQYSIDISKPAKTAKEAIQWLYFAYLATCKDTLGASLPTGNNTAFLDIYIERDLKKGIITEDEAQELVDQFIIKLRMIRFLHSTNCQEQFMSKVPIITEVIGGVKDSQTMITKTAYRFLNTIENINTYPVPNFTILWSNNLPNNFKRYCAKVMLKNNVLQFVNGNNLDSSNYAVTGLAGFSKIGKQIDYYGGTCNLPKALLYAINGGKDEITGETIIKDIPPMSSPFLVYSEVARNFTIVLKSLINVQADALNIMHYMHDKYAYESSLMAFNDTVVERYITFNMCGFATLIDSLSAIKYAKVKVNRDDNGLSNDFAIEGTFPHFGNNDDKVDRIAFDIVKLFNKIVREHHMYRNAKIKVGIESLGLNVKYGLYTGATPDGRMKELAFPIGACPTTNSDKSSLLSSIKSTMKIPSKLCTNGIIKTINVKSEALGSKKSERAENIINLLDGFFKQGGSHLEFNIIDQQILLDAKTKSKEYSYLVLRNGGISIRYNDLSVILKDNLLDRTFHEVL